MLNHECDDIANNDNARSIESFDLSQMKLFCIHSVLRVYTLLANPSVALMSSWVISFSKAL